MQIRMSLGFIIYHCFVYFVNGSVEELAEFDWDEEDCPTSQSIFLSSDQVRWNIPYRAHLTIPHGIRLSTSSIPDIGLGIYSDIFIKKYTWLGDYEGEIILDANQISDYAWKIKRGGIDYLYIDGYNEATSNWLRWINCPAHLKDENIQVLECRGKIYYQTVRDIHPGQELFIYYGDEYAESLGIDLDSYSVL